MIALFLLVTMSAAAGYTWRADRTPDWRAQARRYLSGYLESWTDHRGARALEAVIRKLTNEQLRGG